MAPQELLGLPTELLDRIYSYLDWDRSTSLIPNRPDLFTISLTCKHLRQTVIPHIFRNVRLCLRWADGTLLEPALYHVRRERPDLSQHIRCVFVTTTLGYRPGSKSRELIPEFATPDDIDDWLAPELVMFPERRHFIDLHAEHRKRVENIVHKLSERVQNRIGTAVSPFEILPHRPPYRVPAVNYYYLLLEESKTSANPSTDWSLGSSIGEAGAESTIRDIVAQVSRKAHGDGADRAIDRLTRLMYQNSPGAPSPMNQDVSRIGSSVPSLGTEFDTRDRAHIAWRKTPEAQRLKLEIDAVAAVMLCLPAALTELVFEAGVHGLEDAVWYHFALHLGSAAMEVFGPRLESLTIATGAGSRRMIPHLDSNTTDVVNVQQDQIAHLTNLKHLVFASTASPQGTFNVHQLFMQASQITAWDQACITNTVRRLEFWNTNFHGRELHDLTRLIAHFQVLKSLNFHHVAYVDPGMRSRLQQHTIPPTIIGQVILLRAAIDLRRVIPPNARLTFSDMYWSTRGDRARFPDSALHWLHVEAIPIGASIDEQREERLFEDFESFLYLWEAEDDSERGAAAMVEWDDGKLVDAAMCSRWKQFENVRRDKGEWTTM